ncbi:addiction module antidote protein [Azohydromonas australica]|uniref:addiction module antidote protein n=1 Tax=Azohydromonas australica TaxID=364039 RepID=UPI000684B1FE|nr:addiction module antidote protein [Azohydromonas australica]
MTTGSDNATPPSGSAVRLFMHAEATAAYLSSFIEAGNAAGLAAALGDVARTRGMAQVARNAGLSREALYRALRPDSYPRFDTIVRVCVALGVKLTAHPIDTVR